MSHEAGDQGMNRREALGTAGAVAAAGLLLADAVAADNNPAAQVGDRVSSVKCTSLKATVVGAKCYFKIETNHGITGWGEVTGSEPKVAGALGESLFELLDGENPTRIEHLWQK